MQVFVIDPSAIEIDRTHAAKSVIGHSKALLAAGMRVTWITNEKSSLSDDRIKNYKIFPYTIYDDVRRKRNWLARKLRFPYYKYLIEKTEKKLLGIFKKEGISSGDHLFVPTTDWITLQAIISVLNNKELEGKLPTVHLLIMYEAAGWMTGGYPYKKMVKYIKKSKLDIYLYTETKRHARRLTDEIGMNVSSYPFPCYAENHELNDRKNTKTVCFIGGGRIDKGYRIIPSIIDHFNENSQVDNVTFIVQAPREEDGLNSEFEALKKIRNVQVLENLIDEKTYRQCLLNCSVLVFPYMKRIYYIRGSAIVNEAVANAIPFVCTSDTSLEEMLQEGNGKSAENEQEFSEAIREILIEYTAYSDSALRMAYRFKERLLNNALIGNVKESSSN